MKPATIKPVVAKTKAVAMTKTVAIPQAEYEELKAYQALVVRLLDPCTAAANGDLEHRLALLGEDQPPRVVEVVRTFNRLLDQVDAFVREASASLNKASQGGFYRRFLVRGMHGAFRAAAEQINRATAHMSTQAGDLARSERLRAEERARADLLLLKNIVSVSMSTTEMTVGATNILSASTETQLASSTMASAVDELAASIRDIERSAKESAETATQAKAVTGAGRDQVDELSANVKSAEGAFDSMVDRTKSLQTRVVALGSVVEAISKIAEQTNLLALNATIEAARAGELGKGFGVVASEVKSLSKQTRTATDSIRDQIDALGVAFREMYGEMARAKEGVQVVLGTVDSLGQSFGQVSEGASDISDQVSSLATILSQQRSAVDSLAQNMATTKVNGDRMVSVAKKVEQQGRENLELVERWRTEHAKVEVPNREVYLAKADHVLWKKTVIDFAAGVSNDLSDLKDATQCRLGRWLAEPGRERWKSLIDAPHRKVHEHGVAAAGQFLHRQQETAFEHYNQMESASAEVIKCLDAILAGLGGGPSEPSIAQARKLDPLAEGMRARPAGRDSPAA